MTIKRVLEMCDNLRADYDAKTDVAKAESKKAQSVGDIEKALDLANDSICYTKISMAILDLQSSIIDEVTKEWD